VIAAFDEEFLVVVDVSKDRFAQICWYHEYAVEVGFGVVDFRLFTVDDGLHHLHNLLSQGTGVLKDGHGLIAGDDVLGVGDVAVLAGDQRELFFGEPSADQGVGYTQGGGVVGAENRMQLQTAGVVGSDQVIHAGLGPFGRPL